MNVNVLTSCMTFLVLCFSISSAAAQDRVAVIPLPIAKKIDNLVTVSAAGGDFNDPVAALASITDAGPSNPYLVLIGPGVYALNGPLIMKEHVSIAGSGRLATKLSGSFSGDSNDASSALAVGADNGSLSGLTIENSGSGQYAIGLFSESCSPTFHDLTINVTGATNTYSVVNMTASPSMRDMTVNTLGSGYNRGVYNVSSSPAMDNMIVHAAEGILSRAVYNYSSSPTLTNVTATAINGRGLYNRFSSPTIRHCTLSSVYQKDGGTTRIMQSSLLDGVFVAAGGGTISCVNSDDGIDTQLNADCSK